MTADERSVMVRTVFAFVQGALYVLFGALQVVAGLGMGGGWSEALLLGGGAIDGVIMVIIGLVFIQGHRELLAGLHEGVAFVYVGILLALFFLVVQITQITASYMGAWTVGGEWEGYSARDSISPFLYLALPSLGALWAWRGGFTLMPSGGPGGGVRELNNLKEA
jgi:hypothetical protein